MLKTMRSRLNVLSPFFFHFWILNIYPKGDNMARLRWVKRILLLGALLLGLVVWTVNCGENSSKESKTTPKSSRTPAKRADIVLAYDGWSGTYLPIYVLKIILEENLGYRVEIADLKTIPAAFESVASGRADIFTSAWFPARDATFDKYPNLLKLGQVYGGKAKDACEGWMVSKDVAKSHNLTHVSDLRNRSVTKALDIDGNGKGNLIGCPDTWVCAKRNPEILADYGLSGLYEIEQVNSEKQLLDKIGQRFHQGKPALFYMYLPVGFPGDVSITDRATWLKGTESYLRLAFDRNIVRGDFIVSHPDVARILSEYKMEGADIGRAMEQISRKGAKPKLLTQLARDWIDGHRAEVDSWLKGVAKKPQASMPASEVLTLAYSPEKEALVQNLIIAFNLSRPPNILPIHPIRLEMAEMLQDAIDGKFAAFSPDSSIWLNQLDRMWQQQKTQASSLIGHKARFALSPIVIAMWESRAKEMGYPDKSFGWQDLMKQASTHPGIRWSHPSATTASGLLVTTAEFYAAAGKQSNLTREDLTAEANIDYVKTIEATVERYEGESEDRIVIRMLAEGGHPLDAFVAQEQLVIYFNQNTPEDKLVAIYPAEGTFWMDHPLVLLDGPWVTETQQRTFREFATFVGKPAQQQLVLREGYRPADVTASLKAEGSLIRPAYKVDPEEPKTLLKVPPPGVVEKIRELWRLTKKPANIYLVVDVSGSMEGEKISEAKGALLSFIEQIEGDRDQVAILAFSNESTTLQWLGPVNIKSYRESIRRLKADGGTMLYAAVALAFSRLQHRKDSERINVIIAMTDGQSQGNIAILESMVREAEMTVLIFTVGYGENADMDVLQRIAQLGEGQAYASDPETIESLYELISKFF
jgi:Ca-activated chloride channel family protein